MAASERIVLGSGELYCMEYTGTLPEDSAIEKDENILGHIQGGATVEYKPTFYTCKDDLGKVQKSILTDEEALLKSGIMTWVAETLQKLCTTGRVATTGNTRTLKIGGIGNQDGKSYILHFVHKDPEYAIRLTIVGRNEAGFTLTFAKDKETVVNAEFKAQPKLDKEGTLIIYKEETITPSGT
jgi:hypothetical protein